MALLYPTPEVPLADLTRAALAVAGAGRVSVVTGAGAQVVRVPDSTADRVLAEAGLGWAARPVALLGSAGPDSVALEGTRAAPEPAGDASPGSGAATTATAAATAAPPSAQTEQETEAETAAAPPPEEPAARPPARPAGRAKKTTARRTGTRRKEG